MHWSLYVREAHLVLTEMIRRWMKKGTIEATEMSAEQESDIRIKGEKDERAFVMH